MREDLALCLYFSVLILISLSVRKGLPIALRPRFSTSVQRPLSLSVRRDLGPDLSDFAAVPDGQPCSWRDAFCHFQVVCLNTVSEWSSWDMIATTFDIPPSFLVTVSPAMLVSSP